MARILVADDEEALRNFVSRALRIDGHAVETAADGAEALELMETDAFDLLLSDIRMPAMDGIELALEAARRFPATRILLMTGFAEQRERADGLSAIIVDVIDKPFALADIRKAVAGALQQ